MTRPARRRRALVTTLAMLVAACTAGGDREDRAAGPDAAALQGGTLRVAVADDSADAIDPDPENPSYTAWELARCCLLRTLYSYNGKRAEEGGTEVRPDLAESMPEVSSDGLTWTFRLKRGIRYAPPFEDTPIGAKDIVRALEREARIGMGMKGYGFYYSEIRGFDDYPEEADSIVGLETPDDRTLVVRLTEITGDLPYRFALPATAPIPEGASEGHDDDYGRFLVASGPYMVEGSDDLDFTVPPEQQEPAVGFLPASTTIRNGATEVEEPGSLVLVRNPSWEPERDRLRPAYPDRIEISIGGGDGEELARRVDTGEVDLVLAAATSPLEQVARYQADPALEDRVYEDSKDAGFAVTMNLAAPPFDDLHVRRAVSTAIDEASLAHLVSEPPHTPWGSSAKAGARLAPDSLEGLLLRAFDPYPFDPADAREEMRASDYDPTGDGVCDRPVCRSVRAFVLREGVIPEQAEQVRADLAEIGIELELEVHQWDAFWGHILDPREQIPIAIGFTWNTDFPEGAGWFPYLFDVSGLDDCCNTSLVGASPEQLREWGYRVRSVPSIDDRLDACERRRGVARTQCWAELDQYLMTEVVPRVAYLFMDAAYVVSGRVVRYSFDQFVEYPALDRIALAPGSE
jgi:peptide/nickel transport system substrate-binding protein